MTNDFAVYIVEELGEKFLLETVGAKEFKVVSEDTFEFRVPQEMTGGIVDKISFRSVDDNRHVEITATSKDKTVRSQVIVHDQGMVSLIKEHVESLLCL